MERIDDNRRRLEMAQALEFSQSVQVRCGYVAAGSEKLHPAASKTTERAGRCGSRSAVALVAP